MRGAASLTGLVPGFDKANLVQGGLECFQFFFAFFVLIWGAAIDATSFYTGVHLPGKGYLAFSFIMDLFGLFAVVGVILAIAAGVLVGGIVGALVAVPLAAAGNAVVLHLAALAVPPEEMEAAISASHEEEDDG